MFLKYMTLIAFLVFLMCLPVHANWVNDTYQSAQSNPQGQAAQSCAQGFNESEPRLDGGNNYDDVNPYENQCQSGESWARCMMRVFLDS